jgi:hypothetical protein
LHLSREHAASKVQECVTLNTSHSTARERLCFAFDQEIALEYEITFARCIDTKIVFGSNKRWLET